MRFKTWLEGRRKHKDAPGQGTFWDEPQGTFWDEPEYGGGGGDDAAERQASLALSQYDLSTNKGMATAMQIVTAIAQKHGISPNELWRQVVYQPTGFSSDIENIADESPIERTGPRGDVAFVQNMVDDLKKWHGKNALQKAQEELVKQQRIADGQERGNVKHAASMVAHLQNAIPFLRSKH